MVVGIRDEEFRGGREEEVANVVELSSFFGTIAIALGRTSEGNDATVFIDMSDAITFREKDFA